MAKLFAPVHRGLNELRRRHVFRVTGAYAVCAWLTLQVADVILPALMVPGWVLTAMVILAVLGLPVVVTLSWVFDITPEGVQRTPPAAENSEPVKWSWRWLDFVVIAALLVILALVLMRDGTREAHASELSIAVLPFSDLSTDGNHRYFSDGLSEALMDSLTGIPGLAVTARTSSFAYRDTDQDARQVASALEVSTLVEGSVRRAGDQLRISARLVDGASGRQMWSRTFNAETDDLFGVQDMIARSIAGALQIAQDNSSSPAREPTMNQEAYDEYLTGRGRLRQQGTLDSIEMAIEHFSRALELDPDFTLAEAGLCRARLEQYSLTRESDQAESAIEFCRRAESRDQSQVETLLALGSLYRRTGRVEDAREILQRALAKAPNHEEVHSELGETLRVAGDLERAREHKEKAISLDPAYWRNHWGLSRVLYDQGDLDQALEVVKRSIELEPDSPMPYYTLGAYHFYRDEPLLAAEAFRQSILRHPSAPAYANAGTHYFYGGEYRQAQAMFRQAVVLSPGDYRYRGFLADSLSITDGLDSEEVQDIYQEAIEQARKTLSINTEDRECRAALAGFLARTGQEAEALAELEALEKAGRFDMLTHRSMAMAYLALGQESRAIKHFTASVEAGFPAHLLERDPRVAPTLRQAGLPTPDPDAAR